MNKAIFCIFVIITFTLYGYSIWIAVQKSVDNFERKQNDHKKLKWFNDKSKLTTNTKGIVYKSILLGIKEIQDKTNK